MPHSSVTAVMPLGRPGLPPTTRCKSELVPILDNAAERQFSIGPEPKANNDTHSRLAGKLNLAREGKSLCFKPLREPTLVELMSDSAFISPHVVTIEQVGDYLRSTGFNDAALLDPLLDNVSVSEVAFGGRGLATHEPDLRLGAEFEAVLALKAGGNRLV